MYIVFLQLIIIIPTGCTDLANAGNCEFYRSLEQKFQCGSNGYPLDYGYYYCHEFQKQSSCFTSSVSNFYFMITIRSILIP